MSSTYEELEERIMELETRLSALEQGGTETSLYELEEIDEVSSDDHLLIEKGSDNRDYKVAVGDLLPVDVIEDATSDWMDAHPEASTTVQDGAITEKKLHENLAGKINSTVFLDEDGAFYALVDDGETNTQEET